MKAEMRLCFHTWSTPEITSRPPEARGQAGSRQALRAPRTSPPADTLVSELQPLELWSKKFLVLTLVSVWYFGTTALEDQHTCTHTHTWETLAWLLSPSHCLFLGRVERRGSGEQGLLSCNESDCGGVGARLWKHHAHTFLFKIVLLFKSACMLNCFSHVQLFFHPVDLVEVCKNKEKGSG